MIFQHHTQRRVRSGLALAVSAVLFSGLSAAADRIELGLDKLPANSKGQTSLAKAQQSGDFNVFKSIVGSNDSFKMNADRAIERGETLERGQQLYKGLRVWGAEFAATRDKNGQYNFVVGTLLQNIDRDLGSVKPSLTAAQAQARAKAIKAQSLNDQDDHTRIGKRRSLPPRLDVTRDMKPELVVYQKDNGVAVLAWRVEFALKPVSGKLPSQPVMLIDAKSGALLLEFDNVHSAEARGTGPGGNQRMGQIEHGRTENGVDGALTVDKNGSTCQLKNAKTYVIDAGQSTSPGSTPKSYTCSSSDNRFTEATVNGGYGVLADILYNGTKTVQMYQEWFGVFPIKCASTLKQIGHYDRSYDNAFWQNCTMTYGDGNTFHPLVSMDVVAHEVAHGVTEGRSGLQYSGQSGGLNESFSDMSGTALVYYLTGSNTWKIGDQIKKSSGQMRCMDDPTCDGRSIKHVNNYTNGMDVHFSSGVYNHAFYRLATTSGWNTKKAFEVYYRANDRYWSSSTTFAQAGEGACKAAADLGYDQAQVKASLQAVGVNPTSCSGGTNPTPDTTLSNGVAVTGISFNQGDQKFYILDVPSGASALSFTTTGNNGDVDMYVKFGSKPTTSAYDCKSDGSTSAETCNISTVQVGKYYVLLNGYAASSGVSITGKYTTGGTDPGSDVVLTNGSPVSVSVAAQESKYFKLDVPAGASNLKFVTSGGSGDIDLYVKFGSKPTTTSSDCKSEGSTNAETCNIATAQAGTYYVLVYGYAASSGLTLTGSFTTGGGGGSCGSLPVWNASTYYNAGTEVQYNGRKYRALYGVWYYPPTTAQYWQDLGACQ